MQKLTENYVISNAKIKAALGIKEMPVRAKDGLLKTIKSFEGTQGLSLSHNSRQLAIGNNL